MDGLKIKDNIYWVGALDHEMRIFDLIFKTDHGTTYNAYLIKDEKTALIDAVKEPFTKEYISRIGFSSWHVWRIPVSSYI